MKQSCGCCEGIEEITPQSRVNRPGLKRLVYRVGTHATFLETMKARLSSHKLEITIDETGEQRTIRPLRNLSTRNADDPAIALLDAWAMVGDVLTFYQERIANEGYLRTATERRSVLEIARLVGYELRPGVAASVYLAFTLETGNRGEIPKGTRSQSVPDPGELPQPFETSDAIEAREEWNILQVRLRRPHYITITDDTFEEYYAPTMPKVYFKGISTNLKPNDRIIFVFSDKQRAPVIRQVLKITPNAQADRTRADFSVEEAGAAQLPSPWALAIKSARAKVAHHLDMELFGVSPENPVAIRAAALLERLRKEFGKNVTTGKVLSDFINNAILPGIEFERQQAHQHNAEVLALWLDSVASDLGFIATMLSVFTSTAGGVNTGQINAEPITGLDQLLGSNLLEKPPSQPPLNALRLSRSLQQALFPTTAASKTAPGDEKKFGAVTDMGAQIVAAFNPKLKEPLYAAWRNANVTKPSELISIEAFRIKTTPFGSISQPEPLFDGRGNISGYQEWSIKVEGATTPVPVNGDDDDNSAPLPRPVNILKRNVIALDAIYDQIKPGSWVIIERPPREKVSGETRPDTIITQVTAVGTVAKADFNISAKVTQLTLNANWLDPQDGSFRVIRNTTVYAQSEPLELADEPVQEAVCGNNIELDRLYDGLKSGRWLIVSGERADIPNTDGVQASELVMLAGVTQDIHRIQLDGRTDEGSGEVVFRELPGDRAHTFLQLDKNLAYCYKRETLKIYGNVAEATHGETRNEVLGSGDGARALQAFDLKQSPLTFVPAPTPAGAESTLRVRVNDILWHKADSLAELKPTDRSYITRTDDQSKTTVVFGNGKQGARLPTGVDNVRAVYRSGIGKPGNAKANQITLLQTKPLGVKSVINPMPATGGADRESRDQARRNAPLAVTALDRLVSVQDYADFARTFAGIGKAMASRISDGRRQLVHLTIAGADDIAIDVNSALYRNLVQALYDFGDSHQAFQVEVRELVIIFISANVRIMDDYIWESVEPKIRAHLLDTFSFERRDLGQDVLLSEVINAIQSVEGVAYTDVDTLVGVPEKVPDAVTGERRTRSPEEIARAVKQTLDIRADKGPLPRVPVSLIAASGGTIRPAQIAYLTPVVPDTLILTELKK